MTAWLIKGEGIDSVLQRTGDRRGELAGIFGQTAVDDVGAGLGWSPELTRDVVTAVSELVGAGYTDFLSILQTTDAAVAGVYNAAMAYYNAQEDMAGQFEAEAVNAADTGNFTFFEQNGYYES